MINEDYVSFEIAKLLKEKGFNIPTHTFYNTKKDYILKFDPCLIDRNAGIYVSAPTLQMTMKWLREIHNIFIQISAILQDQPFVLHYRPSIQDYNAYARCDNFSEYVTYEEACEAAIKYCLEDLI